jgi:hypothetical protein
MRFAEVGPIFPTGNQTGSHGILADIMPLLGVGLATPQNVVEKALCQCGDSMADWRRAFGRAFFKDFIHAESEIFRSSKATKAWT